MRFLAMETSSRQGGLALFSGSRCLQESPFAEGLHHGRELTVHLQNMLKGKGLKPADLEAISVSLGPGSFTGIRVGATAAKSLALALGIPVVSESSLRVTAGNALEGAGEGPWRHATHVVPVVSGRGGLFFAGLHAIQAAREAGDPESDPDKSLTLVVADRLGTARDFLRAFREGGLEEGGGGPARVLVVGDGADLFLDDLNAAREAARDAGQDRESRQGLSPLYSRGPSGWDYPRARILGLLTASRVSSATFDIEAIHSLEPLYLRLSYADAKLQAREARGEDLR